jgi:ATP-dependent DNA helicase RecQ
LEYNKELFEYLRELRKILADKAKVPPFVIFGDKSLQEMAYYLPRDKESFAKITGVGAKKLEQYADTFLELINKFGKEYGLESIDIPRDAESIIAVKSKPRQKFYRTTKELIDKKIPLDRIAKNQDIKSATVINHIEKLNFGCITSSV